MIRNQLYRWFSRMQRMLLQQARLFASPPLPLAKASWFFRVTQILQRAISQS